MARVAAFVALLSLAFSLSLAAQKQDRARVGAPARPGLGASENTNLDLASGLPAMVTGALDADDSTYNRLAGSCGAPSAIGTNVFYDTVTLTNTSGILQSVDVTTSDVGDPTQCISGDTFVSVYSPGFNAVSPATNCVTSNDDGGPGVCSALSFDLGVGQTAVVVVASYGNGAQFPYQVNIDSQTCSDGIAYDDASLEGGLHGPMGTGTFEISQRFDLPLLGAAGASVDRACVCLSHTVSAVNDFPVNFVVRRPNSPGTLPGARLHTESVMVMDVPEFPSCRFYTVDLVGVDFDDEPVFIGVEYDQAMFPQLLVAEDTNGSSTQPSFFTTNLGGAWSPATNRDPGYRNLSVRAKLTEPFAALSDTPGLLLPGYNLDLNDPGGATTFFAVRNTTDSSVELNIAYHGVEVTTSPLRVDGATLSAHQTVTTNVRVDTNGLDPDGDDFATGVALFYRSDTSDATDLVGDFFDVDGSNAFAGGDRLVLVPDELCNLMEVRYVDFGSGSKFAVNVDKPRGDVAATFTYTVYDEPGNEIASGDWFTNKHFEIIDAQDLAGPGNNFGTVVFDFSKAGGGAVIAKYSAFGLYTVDLKGACRD